MHRARDSELTRLALAAGEHSRFNRAPRFPKGGFEKLYRLWIERSITHEIADAVFVARRRAGLTGLVTVGEKQGRADIGLIAVDASARGFGFKDG
ncbi:MAG: GNAT family protein [Myxococcaceae bacterium]